MTTDVTALNAPPPTTTILLGTNVRCADGSAGTVDGIVINPNTGAFEYLVVVAGDGHQHFVPRGSLADVGQVITLDMNCAQLQHQPEPTQHAPEDAGLITSHLDNLCVATRSTPVVTSDDMALGSFAGMCFAQGADYSVREVMLHSGATNSVEIMRVDRTSHEQLRVILADAGEVAA